MLEALRDAEEGLVALMLSHVGSADTLANLALSAQWLRSFAMAEAERRIRELIARERLVSRWRRSAYKRGEVLREAQHIERAASYVGRIAGRYRVSPNSVLDIAPSGEFANYSTGSANVRLGFALEGYPDVQAGHCFRGIATVAGVLPAPGHDDFLYLFDRWYVACWHCGREVPADALPFVGDGYQCYSVSASRLVGGVPVLYENEPGPDADKHWRVPWNHPVHWRGPSSVERLARPATLDAPAELHARRMLREQMHARRHLGGAGSTGGSTTPALDGASGADSEGDRDGDRDPLDGEGEIEGEIAGSPLQKIAERLQEWPVGGLAPEDDTRADEALRAAHPPLRHYEPALADLRRVPAPVVVEGGGGA